MCNYVNFRHSFLRYPEESKVAYGEKQGCFEKPDGSRTPRKNIDCPQITPLIYSDEVCNRDAMLEDNPLFHPDSSSLSRYCVGTRLQMRDGPGKGSHKSGECLYHDLNCSEQGKLVKSMTQEAMQVVRKFRTIQQVFLTRH